MEGNRHRRRAILRRIELHARGRCPHRTTAGARFKGGRSSGTSVRNNVAEPARPAGGGGAGGEGLGRSRGGFTSKLHLSADGRCRPLPLVVTGGQRADCTQFKAVLEKIRVPRIGPGRPRTKPGSLAADKGYSNSPCRTYLRRRGIRHIIPEKADGQAARVRRGSRGGRPPGFGEERYKKRNTVERAINRLKQSGPWLPAMTSAATSSSALPLRRPWSCGSVHDRPDLVTGFCEKVVHHMTSNSGEVLSDRLTHHGLPFRVHVWAPLASGGIRPPCVRHPGAVIGLMQT
ncbi:transposase [Streptomyces puniciscabiei]